MRKLVLACLFILLLSASTQGQTFSVVASFTILADLIAPVGGDRISLYTIVPIGAEAHEWELTPKCAQKLARADLFFYNGLSLEQWSPQALTILKPHALGVAIGEKNHFPTLSIPRGSFQGTPDPHIWMDPFGASAYVDSIARVLSLLDPPFASYYEANATTFKKKLAELDHTLRELLSVLPLENRILISGELAFSYFTKAYDFFHEGIWATNAEGEGTPRDMLRVLEIVVETSPKALFFESTTSKRLIRSIAYDTGTPLYGPLYVDSLGSPDSSASCYIQMMLYNTRLLVQALK